MARYRVTGPVAVLKTHAGEQSYQYRNAVVADEEFTAESVESSLGRGLLEEIAEDAASDPESGAASAFTGGPDAASTVTEVEMPDASWTHERINDWAGQWDPPIDLPDGNRKEKVAAIETEIEKRTAAFEASVVASPAE